MNSSRKKTLILSGILLVISTICYFLYELLYNISFNSYYGSNYTIYWPTVIFTIINFIFPILYCLIFGFTQFSHIMYYVMFIMYAMLRAYSSFFTLGSIIEIRVFNIYSLIDILFISIIIVMMVTKAKKHRLLRILGIILFTTNVLFRTGTTIENLVFHSEIGGFAAYLFLFAFQLLELVSLFNIWLTECICDTIKKKTPTIINTSIEHNLVLLKQLYDSGKITEQEYNQKKSEILNKI